jgi:hypothetical protein
LTIAACYVSPEGIVLGADSTTTISAPGSLPHYYNHAQKVFEIGKKSTLGILTWGLGGLAVNSYRRSFAQLSDDLTANAAQSVVDAAQRCADRFWIEYSGNHPFRVPMDRAKALASQPARSPVEETELRNLNDTFSVGFCIGGYTAADRRPSAYEITFTPILTLAPTPVSLADYAPRFYGAPNIILRLLDGSDPGFRNEIINSGFWTGSQNYLDVIAAKYALGHSVLPMRDAVDFVYAVISSTIKALKFSSLPQICGGPI